jgi:DNA-binding transcriptional LysR family regulator
MSRKFEYLGDVELFHAAVESGSFSAAAVALGMTPSAISRAVERLEQRLGLQLLRRTTRSLSLTDSGRIYLEQSQTAFALLDDAERAVQGDPERINGRIRLSVPTTWGHHRAAERLSEFVRRHPQVAIEVSISNRNVDLVGEGFDIAVRLGTLPDSGLVARVLEDAALCLVASPAYLSEMGVPDSLDALSSHLCIPFIMPSTGRRLAWPLRYGGEDIEWTPPEGLSVADDVLGCVSLAMQGAGITQTYDFIVDTPLRDGRLVEVLPQTRGRSRRFSLIYAPHRRLSSATRALIEFLADASKPAAALAANTNG